MSAEIKEAYPLHWAIWQNDPAELESVINENLHDIEKLDPRKRTPLLLAVTLSRLKCTKILLKANANANVEREGFSVLHEAISTGDPELVEEILNRRDYQRYNSRVIDISELLKRIRDTPDFYVEMKWEFTSWLPLVSRMCPSDTYKVYKSGSNVRIDTTLLGFDHSTWQRGSRSYVFKSQGDSATMLEVDHESRSLNMVQMQMPDLEVLQKQMHTSQASVESRLASPTVTTVIDTDKINFERNKSGIWGWRSDRNEIVNSHECKVFSANNVEIVTKTRTEHLSKEDKAKHKTRNDDDQAIVEDAIRHSPLQSLFGIFDSEQKTQIVNGECKDSADNPSQISPEDYFNPEVDLEGRDIGRPKEIASSVQKFKANLWLCEDYPLSLPEQILPIVDLMAISSTHFAKLRDFINLQLPAGFPVKIEIPLFHVVNARITFGNIFSLDKEVAGVTPIRDDSVAVACVVDDDMFDAPSGYSVKLVTDSLRPLSIDEDDELLQYAIQQSLMESGTEEDQVTVWEALRAQRPSPNADDDDMLNKAIQESLSASELPESDLERALKISEKMKEEEENRMREEEEMLAQALRLSLAEQ